MSMKAMVRSSSRSLKQGISPATILQKMQALSAGWVIGSSPELGVERQRGLTPLDSNPRGVAVPGPVGDAPFTQFVLLNLAVFRSRQAASEFEVTRHGEVRHAGLAEADHRGLVERAAGLAYDRGHDLVLGQVRAHRIGSRGGDIGTAQQHLLDLEGGDVLAAPADR